MHAVIDDRTIWRGIAQEKGEKKKEKERQIIASCDRMNTRASSFLAISA